jgi:putative transcriptional regulator
MNKKYKSDAFEAIHDTAQGLYEIGALDKKTMRNFDKSCLVQITEILPQDIKNIRTQEQMSQPLFATYLNVSKNLVSDWERGVKKPSGAALRLLSVVKTHGIHILDSRQS